MNQLLTNSAHTNFYNELVKLIEECNSFYFSVAFINYSGLQLLLDSLKIHNRRTKNSKILTSTYLNFTEPKALEKLIEFPNLQVKIYDSNLLNRGFHPKAYIFEFDDCYKILLGSSNITASAMKSNIEWNIKTVYKKEEFFVKDILSEFYNLWEDSTFLSKDFFKNYKEFYKKQRSIKDFEYKKSFKLNHMQKEALNKLEFLRKNNEKKALVVAATGTGKTYLAAFHARDFKPKRVLFIVHRENILLKAKKSFESIVENKSCGLFTGNKKDNSADYLFATIQTLQNNFKDFSKVEFDTIIVDEAHHVLSPSYEKILNYFSAKFLIGLTATPNRGDGKSIYSYFDDNLACDIRLNDALENQLISSFHYYGISDIESIDYENENINDIDILAKLLMINRRVDYIIEKMDFYSFSGSKRRVLGFCISKEHAKYMSEEFCNKGINSVYLTSEHTVFQREKAIKELEDETCKLEVIFTVDIFNEGVDIPSVNTVLMLRPTDSSVVFIQQLGRGLRKYKDKEFLTLIDFIGNHNKTYLIALALVGDKKLDKESIKLSLLNNFANFKNAHIYIDEISKKRILEQIDEQNFNTMRYLKEQYFEFKQNMGNKVPSLEQYLPYEEFISPLAFISESKSYIEFLQKVEKTQFYDDQVQEKDFVKACRFLESLLPVKRVYEFAFILHLLDNKTLDITKAKKLLKKYLEVVYEDTIKHSFKYLNQDFFDKLQKQRFLKLVDYNEKSNEDISIKRSEEFENILKNSEQKEYLKSVLNYGIINYEKSFGVKDYGLPFLKLYESYNMLNIAKLCNFPKIHTSFRGSGFLKYEDDFFLFVTLQKDKLSKSSKYKNNFLNKELLTYASKPSMSSEKGDGKRLINNKDEGVRLHVFVRKYSHVDKKVQGFTYLGLANCESYKDDKPINIILKLGKPISNHLFEEFCKII